MKKIPPICIAGISGLSLSLAYLFFYVKRVDLSLFHYWQQSVPLSFGESLLSPGGISALLAGRIIELFSLPVQGSLAVALLVLLVSLSLKVIFRAYKSNPLFHALLIAALIPFIILFAHFRLPFELVTSIVAGLFLAMLHSYYSPGKLPLQVLYNFIAGLVVYHVAGVPGVLVFIQAIVVQAVITKKYASLLSLFFLLLLPMLYLPFELSLTVKQAYLGTFSILKYAEIPLIFYLSLSSPLLLLLLYSALNLVFSKFTIKRSLLISLPALFIVLGALFFSTRASYKEKAKNGYRILQASFDDDWDEVIQLTEKATFINQLMQTKVNRALFESGNLLNDLFAYPQQFAENGIFLDGALSSYVAIHTSDFYYDLGFALETRHWATEAQMIMVRHPIVLKQLVMAYIAIGQEEAALKYLRVLSGSRNDREWCEGVNTMLEDGTAGEDPDIRFFRENNPAFDFFAGIKDPVLKLERFYSSNRNNKMAFEFLVASHLLKHDIGAVLTLLPDFKRHGHDRFPRAVEEALMIYVTRTGDPGNALSGYSIGSVTVERFKDFSILATKSENKAERMRMVSKYKDTYWYYILFSSPYAKTK